MSRALWLGALISSAVFAQTKPAAQAAEPEAAPQRTTIDFTDDRIDAPLWGLTMDWDCPHHGPRGGRTYLMRVPADFTELALDVLPAR
jgi:hypothetical protein